MLIDPIKDAIAPALKLLPKSLDTPEARLMLFAIGLQESGFKHRRQMNDGPARGFWQFEQGGGVRGVWRHSASTTLALELCRERDCRFEPLGMWRQLETDDIFAAGMARLLLLTDPKRLPRIGDVDGAWEYYERNWRPGKPHPSKWPLLYETAAATLSLS